MKRKIIVLFFALVAGVGLQARPLKVRVKKPGSLAALVGEKKKYTTREMVLEGTLNGDDLRFLREMAGSDINQQSTPGQLRTIDLRKVTFAQGGGAYVDKEGLHRVTGGAHTLPQFLFRNCPVVHVDLPVRLDTIATGALEHTKLRRIVLPDSVFVMPYAFYEDTELEEVVFPQHVRGVAFYALGHTAVRQVVMHDVDYISAQAFAEMPAVESIEVKGYLGHIDGWQTFYACPRLKSVDFCGVVLSTGGPRLLDNCPVLERVTFHDVVFVTNVGQAEQCPAFRGYEAKATVLYSNEPDVIRPLVIGKRGEDSPAYRAALGRMLPVLKKSIRNGKMVHPFPGYFIYENYDEACRQALEGHREQALEWLDMAVVAGWYNYSHMRDDKDLESLHGDARFQALLERVREVGDFRLVLEKSAPYAANAEEWPAFTYQEPTDSNLVRVREYFNLDSIAGSGDDISRMKNIMYWLHDAIPHNGSSSWPDCDFNAIDLYELCRREGRGLNCRFLAMVLNELYLAAGIPSRFLTCMPMNYRVDTECHVINMAWSRSLNKWVWMDPSFAAFVSDENGLLLHPGEVRERLRRNQPLVLNEDANWNHKTPQTVDYYVKEYMAKNLYWLQAHLRSEYQTEGKRGANSRMIMLVPKGFLSGGGVTTDDAYFWQAPR